MYTCTAFPDGLITNTVFLYVKSKIKMDFFSLSKHINKPALNVFFHFLTYTYSIDIEDRKKMAGRKGGSVSIL